jgi:hypothetical protein
MLGLLFYGFLRVEVPRHGTPSAYVSVGDVGVEPTLLVSIRMFDCVFRNSRVLMLDFLLSPNESGSTVSLIPEK